YENQRRDGCAKKWRAVAHQPFPLTGGKAENQSVLGGAYMMEYISTISYFLTNEMRLFLGLFLVAKVMNFRPKRMLLLLSAAGGVLVTALQIAGLPTIGVLT